MRLDSALNRNSAFFFGSFFIFAVWAFWPSYFSRLSAQPDYRFHAHGIAMTLWCALLIGQALLIRTNRRAIHRQLGKLSYVIAPLLVITTVTFVHLRVAGPLRGYPELPNAGLYFLALTLNSLVVFAVFYGLAIYHRRNAAIHARYMVCTVLPLFSPVSDRLIAAYYPQLIAFVPQIDGTPILPVIGFLLADAILIVLSVWDWLSNRRLNVFPVALGVLGVYHLSVLTFHHLPAWDSFGRWFVRLPLS